MLNVGKVKTRHGSWSQGTWSLVREKDSKKVNGEYRCVEYIESV